MLGERSKKAKVIFFIGLFITSLSALLMSLEFSPLEKLEGLIYDLRFRLIGRTQPPDNIVIATIDEKSIEKFGRWPWGRDKIARLITKLSEIGAELIVFDIFMTEKEEHDPLLAKTVRDAGNVLLPIVFYFDRTTGIKESETLLNAAFYSVKNGEKFGRNAPISVKGVLSPVSELIRESMALGHINMVPDGDGVLRWEMMVIEYHGHLYPSLDLQTAAVYLAVPHEKISVHAADGIQVGSKRYIPTDKYGRSLIYYYGSSETFKHFSIADVMENKLKPGFLQGKIVLIGATALGIYDLRVTPFSAVMAGVEKHANVIASIIETRFLRKAPLYVNLIVLLLCGLLLSVAVGRFKAGVSFGIAALVTVFVVTLSYYLFARKGIWINVAYPVLTVLIVFANGIAYGHAVEERYARTIRAMFSSYVTERVVNELIKNPGMAKLGGERTDVTILFSDVRGFTSFSESHPPEEVVPILNEYLGAMTEIIFKWEGTLDKFMGDAILTFWGAPLKQENHAELAVKCALNMVKRLGELQEKWRSEGKPVLNAGIGINSGEVLVGNIGAEGKKMDYTIIGDHVNLASRVESLTKKYNAQLLITEFTMNKIKEAIEGGSISHMEATGLEKV
ncbi:MAG: adenylate/guanylate cyclase domain-containing protein, partial [Nitrospirota bacterium]